MRAVVFLLALVAAAMAPAALAAQPREQSVYASVIDKHGQPVTGLAVPDFVVTEDGANREVLRAGRTADPIDLAIIIDNSAQIQPYQNDLRKALTAFVTRMAGQHSASVALLTMADRPSILADYTTSVAELTKSVPYERTLDALRESGAGFHALVITDRSGAATRDQLARERGIVIDRGTRETGGRRDDLLSSMALSDALDDLAEDLTQQYKVVYGRPGALVPPKKIDVSVKRPDVETRATLVRPKSGA
jgi:hypothetical protein